MIVRTFIIWFIGVGLVCFGLGQQLNAQDTLSYQPKQVEPGSEESVEIRSMEGDTTVHIYLVNHNTYPVIVTFDAMLRNMIAIPEVPLTQSVDPRSSTYATTFTMKVPFQGWSYRTSIGWKLGDISTSPDTTYAYRLPYAEYQAYRVGQGFMGAFSHQGHASYAVDFVMPEGTEVVAAREGMVVDTRSDSNIQGSEIEYNDDANYIVVWHRDGTFAQYAHLQKDGVLVSEGDRVHRGQVIGISGNTGYTTGPHLHFEVFVTSSPEEQHSIPVCFDTAEGVICNPQERAAYTAVSRSNGSR